jgi:peptidoglycan/xylan/chitin deacetylase (PgdA/CDA1 family)
MARRVRRHAASRRKPWVVAGVVAIVGALGAWAFVGPSSSGGRAQAASSRRHRASSGSAPTSTSSTTTTLPAAPVAIQGGPVAPMISRVPTSNPVVFFTIDDGLVRDPAVIAFLRDHHIPVTMFPVPAYVHQDPGYFDAIHALGASAQDHTLTHPDLRKLGGAALQKEICGVLDDYAARFGARPWLMRPPFGYLSQSVPAVARQCGIRAVVTWRATMNDGRLDVQGGGPLQPGDIILMHFRPDLRGNLEVALNAAQAAGLQPAALEQYLTPA